MHLQRAANGQHRHDRERGPARHQNRGARGASHPGAPHPGTAHSGGAQPGTQHFGSGPASQAASEVRRVESLDPSPESLKALALLQEVIDEAMPLTVKHRAALKGDIRRLWEDLTSGKENRNEEYLGSPPALSAYLRYFLPWNVFRLASIFSNTDFCLPDRAILADIGSGPLTVPIALYVARPELRDVPLTFRCVDRVERVMEKGLVIFESLAVKLEGRLPPWTFDLRRESFGAAQAERAHLLTAANVFNEFFWKDKRPLGERALATARSILSQVRENGSVFIMEPGDPRSGSLISALRAAFLAEGASPLGPCPHALSCPMPGIFRSLAPPEQRAAPDPTIERHNAAPSRYELPRVAMPKSRDKYPWCHFSVDTASAPAWLSSLSESAGLPKDKASFSYLWVARSQNRSATGFAAAPAESAPPAAGPRGRQAAAGKGILVRAVSEAFPLPGRGTGQYGCSSLGYTLLRRASSEEAFAPGSLLLVHSTPDRSPDEKSGAIVLPT